MNKLRFLTNLILLSLSLFILSCSPSEQNRQIETNQQNETEEINQERVNRQENTKETEAEVVSGKGSELTTEGLTQNRDMSQYDQGGHFDCAGGFGKDSFHIGCNENKIRDFVWQHWAKRKRGYIRITYHSEDARSTFHIFIEPNDNGEWNVVWRIARWHTIQKYNNKIDDIWGITVEQVKDKPKKGSWAIIFKNSSGKIIRKIPYYEEYYDE
jgi:hypothetical protein